MGSGVLPSPPRRSPRFSSPPAPKEEKPRLSEHQSARQERVQPQRREHRSTRRSPRKPSRPQRSRSYGDHSRTQAQTQAHESRSFGDRSRPAQMTRREPSDKRTARGRPTGRRAIMDQPTAPKRPRTGTLCCVAKCGANQSRIHAMTEHVPAIFDEEQLLTEKVTAQRLTALHLQSMLLSRTPDLEALASFVNVAGDIRKDDIKVTRRVEKSAKAICQALDLQLPDQLTLTPVTTPGLLMHWSVQAVICGLLPPAKREEMRNTFPAVEPLDIPEAWDSHFHADRTAAKVEAHDLSAMVRSSPGNVSYNCKVRVTGGVAVFCDPKTYPSQQTVDRLREQGAVVSVGIHPKHFDRLDEKDWQSFEAALALHVVISFGEVGLDCITPPKTWGRQHAVLDRALRLLRPDHVLVLHSRRSDRDGGDDMLQLLYQLKGCIPSDQRIHHHCFSGSSYAVEQWCIHFPNTHFGYTTSFHNAGEEAAAALRTMENHRFLLEMDSPYFGCSHHAYATPGHLGSIAAAAVARVRGGSWQDVLTTAGLNGRGLYGVQS